MTLVEGKLEWQCGCVHDDDAWPDDHYADDPRRGQAKDINKERA